MDHKELVEIARQVVNEGNEAAFRVFRQGIHPKDFLVVVEQNERLKQALEGMLNVFNYGTITGIVHDESMAIMKAHQVLESAT